MPMHPDTVALLGVLVLFVVVLIYLAGLRRARRQLFRRLQKDSVFCRRQAD